MKKTLFNLLAICITISIVAVACGKKKINDSNEEESSVEKTVITEIQNSDFNDNWNIAYDAKKNLSKETFDSLKLNTLTFLPPYEDLDFQIGKIILDTEHKKLLSVKAIASGEISEYLLGYIDNNITDSLLIAYEDNVEYYSTTASTIKDSKITVTTINSNYDGPQETADTIITIYNITPNLTFDEVIEE